MYFYTIKLLKFKMMDFPDFIFYQDDKLFLKICYLALIRAETAKINVSIEPDCEEQFRVMWLTNKINELHEEIYYILAN